MKSLISGYGLDAVWMRSVSVIFDIFETPAFQKHSICLLGLLSILSLSLSLSLYLSSQYDRRHKTLCGNILHEVSGMILG